MLNDKKRKFGWSDLKFVSNWRIIVALVGFIITDFIRQYARHGSFNLKEFVVDSVYSTLVLVVLLLLIAYAYYRTEIKREED